jgi:hypothetical protein
MAYKQIWTEQAKQIVIDNWPRNSPTEIRLFVLEYCKERALKSGRTVFMMPTVGGILYQALDHGLIDEAEYEQLRKNQPQKEPVPRDIKIQIMVRDGGRCLVCHNTKRLEVDHIKPRFWGGSNDPDNLQTLCKRCNLIKGINEIDCRELRDTMGSLASIYLDHTTIEPWPMGKYKDNETAIRLTRQMIWDTE